jgi:hypothetical protein
MCEYLSEMYSGQHSKHVARFIIVRQYVSKSFASIAIVIIYSVIIFIIVLDVLKYVFHIDVSHKELEKIRQKKNTHYRNYFTIKYFEHYYFFLLPKIMLSNINTTNVCLKK